MIFTMTSPDHDYPRLCLEVGLTCESCTESSARALARVCPGLRGKMIGQLFVQIYTRSACAPMLTSFERAYSEASRRPMSTAAAAAAVAAA